ncbi:WD repeat and coiled-coil-containing protein [Paramormyrops kingsleyae]|uniref:WD repeat and coiled-coil-containing protein n=1 Tax=Paramormyrops kingsleyae TaxID=1676925 RepID=A0A3B3RJI0_9TELE|nr:WD repeat and coiled-coil-containing protein [Paramormyrops kingsleyae]
MDLGKVKLLRTGLNSLHQAIHPVHGIAWTDGRQISLTSFCFADGQAKFGDTNVIGQFEHVQGLYWGALCCSGTPALLAIQHKKHVSVWQLQLSSLEQNKLLCMQTCELSEPLPLLPQGCVWHPKMDVLAVLTKRDASVLFSVRVDNRRVKAPIKEGGLIRCACWTKDGTQLVVAIGSALHSYIWNDIEKTLFACSFCPVFDVGGSICAIESTEGQQVAVTTELPLDKICSLNAGMAFDVPPEAESPPTFSPILVLSDDSSSDSRRRSVDLEKLGRISLPSSGPIDLTNLLSRHRNSEPSPLIHLRRRDHLTGSGQDLSHLILVRYEQKATTTRKVSIPGILVPDIIAFDRRGCTVAVASNTCNIVLVYCVTPSSIPNIQQVQLEKHDRLKGVCFLDDNTLLVMVGNPKSNDSTFLPSSNTDKYNIRLMIRELVNEESGSLASPSQDSSACLPGVRRFSESFPKEAHAGLTDLVLPAGYAIQPPKNRKKLVEEVKSTDWNPLTSLTDFSDRVTSNMSSLNIEDFNVDIAHRLAGQNCRESGRPCSPRFKTLEKLNSHLIPPNSGGPIRERPAEQLKWNIESISSKFDEVQQCLLEIQDLTRNEKKLVGAYPSALEPPFISVTFQKQLTEDVFVDEKRQVLLCDGKLSLRVLQDLFSLTVVEMMNGNSWIVLVADAYGFVPLTFKPKDKLTVRNGKPKSPAELPCSVEGPRSGNPCGSSLDV